MNIEILAVNAVETSISKTDSLISYLDKNDKTPSWDGSIFVYENNKKIKTNLDGVLKVQIKGVFNDDFSKDIIHYGNIEISDLKNYFNDGGVIYFVVYINNSGNTKIYYANLLPFVIKKVYLDRIKKIKKH